jgi:hypothetical protein
MIYRNAPFRKKKIREKAYITLTLSDRLTKGDKKYRLLILPSTKKRYTRTTNPRARFAGEAEQTGLVVFVKY